MKECEKSGEYNVCVCVWCGVAHKTEPACTRTLFSKRTGWGRGGGGRGGFNSKTV